MLECQKLMMLDSAVSFEETIKNPKPGVKGKGSKVQVRIVEFIIDVIYITYQFQFNFNIIHDMNFSIVIATC